MLKKNEIIKTSWRKLEEPQVKRIFSVVIKTFLFFIFGYHFNKHK